MEEYSEVYQIEQAIIAESSAIYEQAHNMDQDERTEQFVADYNEKLNQRYGFMLDAKEKKKLKKKQRKKRKQQEQENPFQVEESIEEENLYDYITTAVSNDQLASQFFEDSKKKKKSKLSQEEIKNLSTDELLSYIENEGKRKMEDENNGDSDKQVPEESKSMQQMRAKAKAFVQSKMKQETTIDPSCKFCNGNFISNREFVHE